MKIVNFYNFFNYYKVKKQFKQKEQASFMKKLGVRISVMDNKNPVVFLGKSIVEYAKKMKPEIDELFR